MIGEYILYDLILKLLRLVLLHVVYPEENVFHVHLGRICILLLACSVFCVCLFGLINLSCFSSPLFLYWSSVLWLYPLLKMEIEIFSYSVSVFPSILLMFASIFGS